MYKRQWKNSILGIRKGKNLIVHQKINNSNFSLISAYQIGEKVSVKTDSLQKSVYTFNNQIIIRVDTSDIYNINCKKRPIILLQDNPKTNLDRLIKMLKPKQIIADGSNYRNNIKLWKQTCIQQKTPFHSTYENGAYILKE